MAKQKSANERQRWPAITSSVYKPYVIVIGQLALAWNQLHELLALLFIELLANGKGYPATDIWNAAGLDRARRSLLKSLLRTINQKYPAKPRMKPDLEWLLIDKVEDARNDAIHAPLTCRPERTVLDILASGGEKRTRIAVMSHRVIPSIAFDNRRAMKLIDKDLLTEFRWCRDISVILTEYVDKIYEAVAANEPESDAWPHKPVPPNRGMKRKRDAKKMRFEPSSL